MQTSRLIIRLSRTNMTIISAVTHLAAAVMSTSARIPPTSHLFSLPRFLSSWLFILLTQFMTHFLGEVFDFKSDVLNRHASPMTGGSRVLVEGKLSPRFTLRLAIITMLLSLATIFTILPVAARSLAIFILFLAASYSAPPLSLNFRALGELDAAFVTSVLVPHLAAVVQGAAPLFPLIYPPIALLVIPPFLAKISLFLLLNMADRRPDWAGGKITLAVVLGHRRSAILHAVLVASAYMSALIIIATRIFEFDARGRLQSAPQWYHGLALLFLLPSARLGLTFSYTLLKDRSFRMNSLLPPALIHSTVLVWSILTYSIFMSLPTRGCIQPYFLLIAVLFFFSGHNFLGGSRKKETVAPTDDVESSNSSSVNANGDVNENEFVGSTTGSNNSNAVPNGFDSGLQRSQQLQSSVAEGATTDAKGTSILSHDVIIIGGGVAGLVSALTLDAQGLNVIVLERRGRQYANTGADLALWPGAITILRRLGIPSSFFESECFPLHQVHMCNMTFSNSNSAVANGNGSENHIELASLTEQERRTQRPVAEVLKTIDMNAVIEGTGEHFVLVSRQALMDALWSVVPPSLVVCNAEVIRVTEPHDDHVEVSYIADGVEFELTSLLAIGADGARSHTRELVQPGMGGSASIQYRGEVCYRGVLQIDDDLDNDVLDEISPFKVEVRGLLPDSADAATMRINYGAGLRSSFGHMSHDGRTVYWWVKVITPTVPEHRGKLRHCTWPSPLRELHDMTPDNSFYMHAIEDGTNIPKWSSLRVALVGDAAHLVTPNMGQGACMAAEDAFVLCVLLGKYWRYPDGHTEAFYEYEMARKPYAQAVAGEARKQLFLGQLTSSWGVWLRETLLRIVPASVLQKTLRKNIFSVTEYIEEFNRCLTSNK